MKERTHAQPNVPKHNAPYIGNIDDGPDDANSTHDANLNAITRVSNRELVENDQPNVVMDMDVPVTTHAINVDKQIYTLTMHMHRPSTMKSDKLSRFDLQFLLPVDSNPHSMTINFQDNVQLKLYADSETSPTVYFTACRRLRFERHTVEIVKKFENLELSGVGIVPFAIHPEGILIVNAKPLDTQQWGVYLSPSMIDLKNHLARLMIPKISDDFVAVFNVTPNSVCLRPDMLHEVMLTNIHQMISLACIKGIVTKINRLRNIDAKESERFIATGIMYYPIDLLEVLNAETFYTFRKNIELSIHDNRMCVRLILNAISGQSKEKINIIALQLRKIAFLLAAFALARLHYMEHTPMYPSNLSDPKFDMDWFRDYSRTIDPTNAGFLTAENADFIMLGDANSFKNLADRVIEACNSFEKSHGRIDSSNREVISSVNVMKRKNARAKEPDANLEYTKIDQGRVVYMNPY
jgi:hypothetical protein